MIKEAIRKVVGRTDLSEAQMRDVFGEIMSGKATPAQIGALAVALRMKGETVDEITGAAKAMRGKSLKIRMGRSSDMLLDTCGTGGSGINTFNISTAVAFVSAGAGLKVAKHGNRGASSQCGSADVLEALGVNLNISPDRIKRCIEKIGIGFIYAPLFHIAMKYAIAPRKEIGIRTIFNLLGPLSNPANATSQVLGVYDIKLTETIASVLRNLGCRRALVVCGIDGLDEITIAGRTKITELNKGRLKTYFINPEKFGMRRSNLSRISGGDAKENANILLSILEGKKGPHRDIVLLNAAAALMAGCKADNFKDGIDLAKDSIDSGAAAEKLSRLIAMTGAR